MIKTIVLIIALLPVSPINVLAADDQVNLVGDWEIHSSVGGTVPIIVNCALEQQGDKLSGTCTPVMENPEPATLTGKVTGNAANWDYGVVFNGNAGTVGFQADVITQDGMLGTLNLSGTTAPFVALKR